MSSFGETTGPSSHSGLTHYCAVDSFKKIILNRTLKCTNLSSMQLNDRFEAKRKNLESETRLFFIACFSHSKHEIVPLWKNYGGDCPSCKVALKFKNFCGPTIADDDDYPLKFFPHYGLETNGTKIELNPEEFFCPGDEKSAHNDYMKTLREEGELANYRARVLFKDVEYVKKCEIDKMDNISHLPLPNGHEVQVKDTLELGRLKTKPWAYEVETRIICHTNMKLDSVTKEYPYREAIFLKLADEFFRDLKIILSPWRSDYLKCYVESIINESPIGKEIKDTITICDSELYDQV